MEQNRASFTDTSNDDEQAVVVSGTDTATSEDVAVSAAQVNDAQDFKKIEGLPGVGGNETPKPYPTKDGR